MANQTVVLTEDPSSKGAHLLPNQHCSLEIDEEGTHRWRNPQGQLHRVGEDGVQDGPAVIYQDGSQSWYARGRNHRLDGPAWVWIGVHPEWCLDGREMTQQEWAQDPRVIEYNSCTQEEAEEWLTRL